MGSFWGHRCICCQICAPSKWSHHWARAHPRPRFPLFLKVGYFIITCILLFSRLHTEFQEQIQTACSLTLRGSMIKPISNYTDNLLRPCQSPGGQDFHIKQTGKLIVLLRGVNFWCMVPLRVLQANPNILTRKGLVQGCMGSKREE